ncbi:uncharacterized protein DNG_01342 [Cephalotrichum gorgonifer]|uniref:TATA element modulatory factor 1 TATA binding domain-containing protein n=1 Tax=Cephalotrichum gorgonifer TaxID=2041049 RepID=A0AAE8SS33_9PEZI|nr:uncharacterized protein DNG_01342 [Cephalotrichum gorgonifer]
MSAPGQPSKWGSFFQQAVAGVEARLDTMLSEGEYAADYVKDTKDTKDVNDTSSIPPARGSLEVTAVPPVRTPTPRSNTKLQERLARAVANRTASPAAARDSASLAQQDEAAATPDEPKELAQTRPESPARPVIDKVLDNDQDGPAAIELPPTAALDGATPPENDGQLEPAHDSAGPLPASAAPVSPQPQADPVATPESHHSDADNDCPSCGALRGHIRSLEERLAELESQGREEHHTHVERVDALESKLKFLTREMAESARKSVASAPAGSIGKQIAEKDEKIALLMSEGQTLAATEHKHRSIIKRLRSEVAERDKSLSDLTDEKGRLASQLESQQQSESATQSLQSELEALKGKCSDLQGRSNHLQLECSAKGETIKALELELERMTRAPSSGNPQSSESSAEEGKRVAELEELVTTLRAEKERAADKARAQVDELREKADVATEQGRQMKNELQTLEGKLEAMRVIAEEASSNAAGDAQAKLLRQIETLQSQYATACENWQGIEASLTARIAILERERDEVSRKETETRKKAKDLSSRNRQQLEDLHQLRARIDGFQQEEDANQRDLARLRKRAEAAEAALAKANEQQQQQPQHREVEDRARLCASPDTIPSRTELGSRLPGRPLSPLHSPLRTWSSELLVPHPPSKPSRAGSVASGPLDAFSRLGSPREPSGQAVTPVSPPGSGRQYLSYDASMDSIARPSSSRGQGREDDSDSDVLSTVHRAIPDIASVSTTAAGPSIQLVERMSAGIRRLEAEKVAGREDLLRISNQRDEARAEIVTLMKQIESSRQATDRVAALEKEVAEINERYQTTLELLGEKTELVEELRSDVEDVKAMYRELIERTIR